MSRWSEAQQEHWKQSLKRLIKKTGQSQVDVARQMAILLAKEEGTPLIETAFVAPLSRFVNGKGNEIYRWFEEDSRLNALAQAMHSSPNALISLRDSIDFGNSDPFFHRAFPDLDWGTLGERSSSEPFEITVASQFEADLFRFANRAPSFSLMIDEDGNSLSYYSRIEWSDMHSRLLPILQDVHQVSRCNSLPADIWERSNWDLDAKLWQLYWMITEDVFWKADGLHPNWTTTLMDKWVQFFWMEPCMTHPILARLSPSVHRRIWEKCMRSPGFEVSMDDWQLMLKMVLGTGTSVQQVDETILQQLASKQSKDREQALQRLREQINPINPEQVSKALVESKLILPASSPEKGFVLRNKRRWEWLIWKQESAEFSFELGEFRPLNPRQHHACTQLWWCLQTHAYSLGSRMLEHLYQENKMDWANALFFLLTETHRHERDDFQRLLQSEQQTVEVWQLLLCMEYSGLYIWSIQSRSDFIERMRRLSKNARSILPKVTGWEDVMDACQWKFPKRTAPLAHLVHYTPFQIVPATLAEWVLLQNRTSFPIWKVLEESANFGNVQSQRLLGEGDIQFASVWNQVPIARRLHWLSFCDVTAQTLYVFQMMVLEYWQQPNPSLNFILSIAEKIGFDTVLKWMEGWVSPLFVLQQESGDVLAIVAFRFGEHFKRWDIIQAWRQALWDWLVSPEAIHNGFVQWNGRRAPLLEREPKDLFHSVCDLVQLGIDLHPDIAFIHAIVSEVLGGLKIAEQYSVVEQLQRRMKIHCYRNSDTLLLQRWIATAPNVDFDLERCALESATLLTHLWRMDGDGLRRNEILRLAALHRPVPSWAIAQAQQFVLHHHCWPVWISPFAPEVASLISLMLESARGEHQLWWLRVHQHHFGLSDEVWQGLSNWFSTSNWEHTRTKTVHFLAPNHTPTLDLQDVLQWILRLQQGDIVKTVASGLFFEELFALWKRKVMDLDAGLAFSWLTILNNQGFQMSLYSWEGFQGCFERLAPQLQSTLKTQWFGLCDKGLCTLDWEHPIFSEWSMEWALIRDDQRAWHHLEQFLRQGEIGILDMVIYHKMKGLSALSTDIRKATIHQICTLLDVFLDSHVERNQATRQCTQWLWGHPTLLQQEDPIWQEWLMVFLDGKNERF